MTTNDELEERLRTQSKDLKDNQAEKKHLNRANNEQMKRIETLTRKNAELQNANDGLQKAFAGLENENVNLKSAVRSAERKMRDIRSQAAEVAKPR